MKILLILMIHSILFFYSLAFSPYNNLDYTVDSGLPMIGNNISQVLMSRDMSTIIMVPNTTTTPKVIYLYHADLNNFQYISLAIQSDTLQYFVRADRDLNKIIVYGPGYRKVQVYVRTGLILNLVQENISPLLTSCNSLEISADGVYLNFGILGTSKVLVTYQWNGAQYVLGINSTLNTASSFRALSPDGKYIVYGEKYADAGTSNIRVVNNQNPSQQFTYRNFTSVTTPVPGAQILWIGVGQPEAGKYDIVCWYMVNNVYYLAYVQFDNATNNLAGASYQDIALNFPTSSFYRFFLTDNGRYLAMIEKWQMFRLYQKQLGQYVQVYNKAVAFTGYGMVYFVTDDASLIAIRTVGLRMVFLFKCDVSNCLKCTWINLCHICEKGYILVENACVCPEGQFNLSDVCINCSISNCITCSANNVCTGCGNGYVLTNNTCMCPSTMNVSQVTGKCVTCSVLNCYKCLYDDICELFLPVVFPSNNNTGNGSMGSNSLFSNSENTQDSVSRIQSIVIALAVVIGIVLLILVVIGLVLINIMKASASINPGIIENGEKTSFQKINQSALKQSNQINKTQANLVDQQPDQLNEKPQAPLDQLMPPQQLTRPQQQSQTLQSFNDFLTKGKQKNKKKLNFLNHFEGLNNPI